MKLFTINYLLTINASYLLMHRKYYIENLLIIRFFFNFDIFKFAF